MLSLVGLIPLVFSVLILVFLQTVKQILPLSYRCDNIYLLYSLYHESVFIYDSQYKDLVDYVTIHLVRPHGPAEHIALT